MGRESFIKNPTVTIRHMKDTIKISAETLLDELLWYATRYCIGRRSYVTGNAEDYWRIIHHNRDKFSAERLKFFARDIRVYISDAVGFYSNVQVDNAYNDRIVYDAYTLLAKHLADEKEMPRNRRYVVDCISGDIQTESREPERIFSLFKPEECEYYLLPWVRLANCIDRQYEVTCKNASKVDKAICIQDPDGTYTCVENWNRFANTEYIKDIKPIEL